MATHPSASNQDPTLYCAYFGGPRDGLKSGDLPASLSGQKLTGMISKMPLTQPQELSDYAVYKCTSEAQVNGFWEFHYQGLEGPNGEALGSAMPDLVQERANPAARPEEPQTSLQMDHAAVPANWESKVRGLMLGLTLGDARASIAETDLPTTPLLAGTATHLAAWTAAGLLRRTSGQDVIRNSNCGTPRTEGIRSAYQHWASLHGVKPVGRESWLTREDEIHGGWLPDVPIMALSRGHSPSMEHAVATGLRSAHDSCRPLIKGLPIAVCAGPEGTAQSGSSNTGELARSVAGMTHNDESVLATSALAVRIAIRCLQGQGSFDTVLDEVLANEVDPELLQAMTNAIQLARAAPARIDWLTILAPNDKSVSVLTGSVYATLSFPGPGMAKQALEFARRAPDGDGVAAVVGAFMGALHGYEIFPTERISRLELGWVMDRLAIDLAMDARANQPSRGNAASRSETEAGLTICRHCGANLILDCACPDEDLGPVIARLMHALNVSEAKPQPLVKIIKTWRSFQISPDVLFLIDFEDGTAACTAPMCVLEPRSGQFEGQLVELEYNSLGQITLLRAPSNT